MVVAKNNESYILKKPKMKVYSFIFIFYFIFYYQVMPSFYSLDDLPYQIFYYISHSWRNAALFIVPIPLFPLIIKILKFIFNLEDIYLDNLNRKIFKGKRIICHYGEVKYIRIQKKTNYDDDIDTNKLFIDYGEERMLKVGETLNIDNLYQMADFLAKILDVKIKKVRIIP